MRPWSFSFHPKPEHVIGVIFFTGMACIFVGLLVVIWNIPGAWVSVKVLFTGVLLAVTGGILICLTD